MAFSRRALLKWSGYGALAALLPRGRATGSQDPAASQSGPPDLRHLAHGLNLLCGAHASDAFRTGHAGGAVISAYYLCREEKLEAGSADVIRKALEQQYPLAPDPFPAEQPAAGGVQPLLAALEEGIDQLCRSGHDVIFLSLALKAMHELPQSATPARLEGLRRTIQALEPRTRGTGDLAVPASVPEFAEFVLQEFLGSTEGGPGQGYSGHVLTHGRAILDLRALGHEAFAQKCLNAYQLAIKQARPRAPGKDYKAERPKVEFLRPDAKQYWERRAAAGSVELGHMFKYPYGFFGLIRQSKNQELNEVCLANSHRLFRS